MAIFFLLVGMEIKREALEGSLSSMRQAGLPVIAAIGGMIVPAAMFSFIINDAPQFMAGWSDSDGDGYCVCAGCVVIIKWPCSSLVEGFFTGSGDY